MVEQQKDTALKRSLKLIYVYAIATGAIFTFIGYWDSVFISYCGPATFLAFAAMTVAVLPIAFVYCELAPLFPQVGTELCYNTIGMNKHVGFFSSWFIMMAWIAVPPAAVMAIIAWLDYVFKIGMSFGTIVTVGIITIIIYCIISLNDIQLAGKIQLVMLIGAIAGSIITAVMLIFSEPWSFSNFTQGGFFQSSIGDGGFGGWMIGLALIITPYFGFEIVPQMVEEGSFPIKDSTKAIWGSVVTCGVVYTVFYFAVGGLAPYDPQTILVGVEGAEGGFITIFAMEQLLGWTVWPLIFGVAAILCAIGTCLLGFWLSTVRLIYAMGRQNYLPAFFSYVNKKQQPIWPNIFLMIISIVFLLIMNSNTFIKDFFNLMAFGCGLAYSLTSISAMRIRKKHPEWVSPYRMPGGQFTRILALVIAVLIAIGTCIGQGVGSWICFAIYVGVGVLLWISMLFKWRKVKVHWMTPDGEKEF